MSGPPHKPQMLTVTYVPIGADTWSLEQQMLAIGRALVRNPRALLLDEPSEGLAPRIVDQVRDIVIRLTDEGETIVIAEQEHAHGTGHRRRRDRARTL